MSNYKKALKLAKEKMKKSVNESHGEKHAKLVEKHAIAIWKSLKKDKKWNPNPNKQMISLVAWWHDAYKSDHKKLGFWDSLAEDVSTAELMEKALSDTLSKKDLEALIIAVKYHKLPFLRLLEPKKYNTLAQILFEADGLEDLNWERRSKQLKSEQSIFTKMLFSFESATIIILGWMVIESEYSKKVYRERVNEFFEKLLDRTDNFFKNGA